MRFLSKFHPAMFGIVGSIILVLVHLLTLLSLVLSKAYENGLNELLMTAVNVIFYLNIGRFFLRAKNYDDPRSMAIALGVVIIFDYIVPALRTLIQGVIFGEIEIAILSILFSGIAIGILYFVFLILELKRRIRNPYIFLIIFGALLLALNLAYGVLQIIVGADYLIAVSGSELETSLFASSVITGITYFLSAAGGVCFGLSYLIYPIIKNIRVNRGY